MTLTHLVAALQIATLAPALPDGAKVFDLQQANGDIVKLCGPDNRRCRETQEANITLLREGYDAKAGKPEQRLKLLTIIDDERARGTLDWMIVRSTYNQWLENVGAKPRPNYPAPPRNSTRCVSRMGGGVYTSECNSY